MTTDSSKATRIAPHDFQGTGPGVVNSDLCLICGKEWREHTPKAAFDAMKEALEDARPYVVDALDAHEHSDGRNLLSRIDAALRLASGEEQ